MEGRVSAPNKQNNSIMAALEQFEATEANLVKLERLWDEMAAMIPDGVAFGENIEYEDRGRSFELLLDSLPKIGGWKPTATPPDLDGLAQSRLDAMEIDEPSAQVSVERWTKSPGANCGTTAFDSTIRERHSSVTRSLA